MFKNPFSFNGRIRRLEYGLTYLACIVISMSLSALIVPEPNSDSSQTTMIIYLALLVPMYWIMLAQGAKRCHDHGRSGWFQIIPFYVFWMLFSSSEYGPNKYGPNPKGEGNFDDIDEIGNYLQPEPVQH